MATTTTTSDSLNSVSFPTDLTNPPWDAPVPYPSSMSIPDTDNIIAELSMYEPAITTPITSTDNIDSALSSSADPSPQPQPQPQPLSSQPTRKRPAVLTCMPSPYTSKKAKLEQAFATEPLTPHSASRSPSSPSSSTRASLPLSSNTKTTNTTTTTNPSIIPMVLPPSPNPSACTDEPTDEDIDRSISPTTSSSDLHHSMSLHNTTTFQQQQQQQSHYYRPHQNNTYPTSQQHHSYRPQQQQQQQHKQHQLTTQHKQTQQQQQQQQTHSPQVSSTSNSTALGFKQQSAHRRALRKAALKKSRARKEGYVMSTSTCGINSFIKSESIKGEALVISGNLTHGMDTNTSTPNSNPSFSSHHNQHHHSTTNPTSSLNGMRNNHDNTNTTSTNNTMNTTTTTTTTNTNGVSNLAATSTTASPTSTTSNGNGGEPVDKKAARAIRNREAAMKSRIEAKNKMRKLQDENASLVDKVQSLSQEKEALTAQLWTLLKHMGLKVDESQDIKRFFNL